MKLDFFHWLTTDICANLIAFAVNPMALLAAIPPARLQEYNFALSELGRSGVAELSGLVGASVPKIAAWVAVSCRFATRAVCVRAMSKVAVGISVSVAEAVGRVVGVSEGTAVGVFVQAGGSVGNSGRVGVAATATSTATLIVGIDGAGLQPATMTNIPTAKGPAAARGMRTWSIRCDIAENILAGHVGATMASCLRPKICTSPRRMSRPTAPGFLVRLRPLPN